MIMLNKNEMAIVNDVLKRTDENNQLYRKLQIHMYKKKQYDAEHDIFHLIENKYPIFRDDDDDADDADGDDGMWNKSSSKKRVSFSTKLETVVAVIPNTDDLRDSMLNLVYWWNLTELRRYKNEAFNELCIGILKNPSFSKFQVEIFLYCPDIQQTQHIIT